MRISGDRGDGRRSRSARGAAVAVDEIRQPRRPARRRHERIELVIQHRRVDAERSRHLTVPREIGLVFRARQRLFFVGHRHDLLAEVRHLFVPVRLVERDDVGERDGRGGSEPCQVFLQIGFKFIEQQVEFAVVELSERRNVDGVDDHGALPLHIGDGVVCDPIGGCAVAEEPVPDHAEARAFQGCGVEADCVVAAAAARTRLGDCVLGVGADERAENPCGVRDRTRHRPGGVLAMCYWHNASSTQESQCWLDPDKPVIV